MSSCRYSLRSTVSRVAATRAAQKLGISANEARRHRARPAPRCQQPRRIRLIGAWAPENITHTLREERLRRQTNSYHIIIQTRPFENPDRPQVEVIRHAVLSSFHEGQGQQQPYSVRQFAYQRLHSIHDNEQGTFVYHYKRDAHRNISATWFGRICVSLYDFDLRGTIWENPGMLDYTLKEKALFWGTNLASVGSHFMMA